MSRFDDLLAEQVYAITGDSDETLRTLEEWQPIFEQAKEQLMANIEQIAPDVSLSARHSLRDGGKRRFREAKHNERAHLKKLGPGFRQLKDAVTLAGEVNRDLTTEFAKWISRKGRKNVSASIVGFPGTVGGPAVRALTFLGLHARSCTLASEILLLAQHGFTEGAFSRARSLYELVTIIAFLSIKDSHPFELTERYSLSGLVEARRDLQGAEAEDPFATEPGLEEAIRNAWGDRFFKPHGWAIPAIGDGTAKQVTFRDIEKSLGSEHLRHAYLTMNHAVHAGAKIMVERFNTERPFLNYVGSSVDYYGAAWVLSATSYLFRGAQIPLLLEISPLIEAEMELMLAPLSNLCNNAQSFFNSYTDQNDPVGGTEQDHSYNSGT
ncbi:DUF5677 domain-containing protein [Streptomyces minutiscleroticus]|uniref:DUF5677 domain-containing protein n=1 Tax=Streptomyces minutiscleroticus TaxID=68238 RepID=UPI00332F1277